MVCSVRSRHGALQVECALHLAAKAHDYALASEWDQFDGALLARLEADRRTGGDVQAHTPCRISVELQAGIDLGEVVV
jgi:hypothetical protein